MTNLFTKILVISLLFRISTSLECHKCNKGYLAFIPPELHETYKEGFKRDQENIRRIESSPDSSELVLFGCQAA